MEAVGRRGCWFLITGLRSLEGKRKGKKPQPKPQAFVRNAVWEGRKEEDRNSSNSVLR